MAGASPNGCKNQMLAFEMAEGEMVGLKFELVIIGGGIVGLATALEAVQKYPRLRVAVVEKESAIATHQSGHNSGVIHSGIYYQPGSLKAKNCVAGAAALVQFCAGHGIPYDICGKVIVATQKSEVPALEELWRRGITNGVAGLGIIGSERLRELEPHCAGVAALHVPTTGITDFKVVAQKYAELVEAGGGQVLTECQVRAIRKGNRKLVLETGRGSIETTWAINCAGLYSDRVMKLAGDDNGTEIVPFRGEYYRIAPARQGLVRNLIYPMPDPRFPFLGVHFTRRIGGGVDAGPNAVLALKREGYRKTGFNLRDALETAAFPGFWRLAAKYWNSGIAESIAR